MQICKKDKFTYLNIIRINLRIITNMKSFLVSDNELNLELQTLFERRKNILLTSVRNVYSFLDFLSYKSRKNCLSGKTISIRFFKDLDKSDTNKEKCCFNSLVINKYDINTYFENIP